jgi:hypothetical protein
MYKKFGPKDDVSCIPLVQTKIKDGFRRPDKVGAKGRKADNAVGHRRKWEVVERQMIEVFATGDVSVRDL